MILLYICSMSRSNTQLRPAGTEPAVSLLGLLLLVLGIAVTGSCVLNGKPQSAETPASIRSAGTAPEQTESAYTPVLVPDTKEEALRVLEEEKLEFTTHGFQMALRDGREDYFRLYLAAGIDPLAVDEEKHWVGSTALMAAVQGGLPGAVDGLVEFGSDINAKMPGTGLTPVHMAVQLRDTESLRILLDKGGDLEAEDRRGWTPLFYAAATGNKELFDFLASMGADLDRTTHEGQTLLMASVLGRNLELVEDLVDRGAEVDARDKMGGTAFWIAVRKQEPAIMQYLINLGAEVNVSSDLLSPALHQASFRGNHEVVRLLLENGADVELKDAVKGRTALHFAAQAGTIRCARMLLEAGVDPTAVDEDGATALDLARDARDHVVEHHGPTAANAKEKPSLQNPEFMTQRDYNGLVLLLERRTESDPATR